MTLIVNAAQAIDGEAQITGSTTHDVDCVATRIADTGQGNCAGERPRVFEPFFRPNRWVMAPDLGVAVVRDRCPSRERSKWGSEQEAGIVFTETLPVSGDAGALKARDADGELEWVDFDSKEQLK